MGSANTVPPLPIGGPDGTALIVALRQIVGDAYAGAPTAEVLSDATVQRGVRGRADAVVAPADTAAVTAVMAWCYDHDVALTPRGGGSGLAGGAVPSGGVVLDLRRLNRVLSIEPELWRMQVEAGVVTADVRRRARENGLLFAPDPGSAEQSTIGGNIATNAGGPHAFRYGVTGNWVTGLTVVVPPGEVIELGGPLRKDVSGLDLKSLLIGSEGVLGVITEAWLKLIPAPEVALPVVALFDGASAAAEGLAMVMGSGIEPSVLEYLDAATVQLAASQFPVELAPPARLSVPASTAPTAPPSHGVMVIAEGDGSAERARAVREELIDAFTEAGGRVVHAPESPSEVSAFWRWRDSVSLIVTAAHGGKLSEDIVVPVDRLAEAIDGVLAIGARHGLPACSWGHGGDGNLHATFLLDSGTPGQLERAELAAHEVFALALELGGTLSGEHGIGTLKRDELAAHWSDTDRRLHAGIKQVFDPKGLLNPGTLIG